MNARRPRLARWNVRMEWAALAVCIILAPFLGAYATIEWAAAYVAHWLHIR